MAQISLANRLLSVAKHVRADAVFADVGTDHAYLPISLIQSEKIKRAICADINEGPLARARKNAEECNVSEKIEFLISDGFDAFGNRSFTDAAVCGMGGELILDIVTRARERLTDGVRLILQPMSKQAVLRRGLYSLGFEILCEEYSSDKNKHYLTIVARFSGKSRQISDIEAEIGISGTRVELNESKIAYFTERRTSLVKSIRGAHITGTSSLVKEQILEKIDEILNLRGN